MTKSKSILSCLDSGRVKVLLLPLNEFPTYSWEECVENIRKNQEFELSELESRESDDVILKKLGGPGKLNYHFITSIDSNTSDFVDFQLHQRVFGIIGLANGEIETEKGEKILKECKEKFPYNIVSSIFVFNTTIMDLNSKMSQFATKILENMSELMLDMNQRPSIPSPCGIEDYSGTASRSSTAKTKMRQGGRLQKLLADLHLLTGYYSEAVTGYVSAAEDAKIANDSIWSAASQEGFNIALCLQNEQLMNGDSTEIYKSLIEKLIPLASIYERSGTPILSIDLQITCSRIHRFVNQGSQALNVLADSWKSCNLLAFDEKCLAYNRVLRELAGAGNWRKWALYMVQFAQTLKLAQNPELALTILSKTLTTYNLTQSDSDCDHQHKGWPAVQSALLKEMVKLSESHSNRLLYFLYGWMYLAYSNKWQDAADQVQIMENLKKKSMRDMFLLSSQGVGRNEFVCSLPIFEELCLEKANNGLFVIDNQDSGTMKSSGPFIYNPNSVSNNSTNLNLQEVKSLISGESASFKLTLSNPFMFPIVLKNIHLITDDSENPRVSEQVSITLPPMTKNRNVSISLLPTSTGTLRILGFCATFMNVEIQFLIDSKGKVLLNRSVSEKDLGMTFNVIESQAFLNCSCDDLENGLQLYEGESFETHLIFYNLTSASISKANFRILEDQKASNVPDFDINEIIFGDEQQSSFSIDSDVFDKLLPLNQSKFSIPLKLFGTLNGSIRTGNLEVLYSSTGLYWRKLVFPLLITICPIVKLEKLSFYPKPDDSNDFKSVLSKFKEFNSENCCVGSFVARNLESSFALKLSLEVIANLPVIEEEIPSESAKRFIFLIPRLQKPESGKLPLNEKTTALVRKLRKSDKDDFLDDSFEDFLYDKDQFWIKKYLIETLKVKWSAEGRTGQVSLTQCEIPSVYHDSLLKEHFVVSADASEFRNLKLGQEVKVTFTICPKDDENEVDYRLKLFPVVILNDREVGQNFDHVLKYTGCLDSIVRKASRKAPETRTFKFYPIASATLKIIYQVIEIQTGHVHWCENPIILETK